MNPVTLRQYRFADPPVTGFLPARLLFSFGLKADTHSSHHLAASMLFCRQWRRAISFASGPVMDRKGFFSRF